MGRLAKRLGKDADGPGDALGAALAVGFRDLIAQRRGDASYGGTVYLLANGKTARLDASDGPEFIVVADAGTGDDGQCRIYAYATIDREELEPYVSSSRKSSPCRLRATRCAPATSRLLVPSSSSRRRPRSRRLRKPWSFFWRPFATSAASEKL